MRIPSPLCLPTRSGARHRRSRGGSGSPERGGSGHSGQVHYITARRPLTPRQAAAGRADPWINPIHPPARVHGGAGGVELPGAFRRLGAGIFPATLSAPRAARGAPAPAPPAPPPRPLPAPRERGPRRLGPGKGPPRGDAARWVHPGGMSARHRPGCSGPREVSQRSGREERGICTNWAGCGGLEAGPPGCRGAVSRRSLWHQDPQRTGPGAHWHTLCPLSGRGGSGDPGILRGRAAGSRAGLGGGGRGRSLGCPATHREPATIAWSLGAPVVLGKDTCPPAPAVLGRCSGRFWAGGWTGSGFDPHLL